MATANPALARVSTDLAAAVTAYAAEVTAAEAVTSKLTAAFQFVATATRALVSAVSSAIRGIAAPFTALAQSVTGLISSFSGVASGVMGVFDRLQSSVGRFVSASNPAEMERFQIVVRDLAAAFGRILEPFIIAGQQVAMMLNEFVTALQPVIGPLMKQLADTFVVLARAILDAVSPIIDALIPVARMLVDAFSQAVLIVAPVLKEFGLLVGGVIEAIKPLVEIILPPLLTIFKTLADAIREVINFFRRLVGASQLQAGGQQRRRTVAAQPARQIGIEEIGREMRAAAMSTTERGENYPRSTAQAAREIVVGLQMQHALMRQMGRSAEDIRGIVAAIQRAQQRVDQLSEVQ